MYFFKKKFLKPDLMYNVTSGDGLFLSIMESKSGLRELEKLRRNLRRSLA